MNNIKHLLLIGMAAAAAALLSGCNTTGTTAARAPIQANQMGDANMTCQEIEAEVAEMNKILGIAEDEMRGAQALGLTESIAVSGIVYSGAAGSAGAAVPYLGHAITAVGQMNEMNKKQAEELARSAFNRRSVLTGMYAAKGCGK
ncbi:MAG: hypothetical protein GVY36_08860 [Verrucomicrobia bacterium]|jgi:hypothetical protein|nr:hypothetical protein [Verrucomicrobiota bacterium]